MYWDSAATTPVKPEVLKAMMPYFVDKWYNPSAIYEPAKQVRRDIEKARKIIADSINADPEEIFFTSGASESNSWILNNFNHIKTTNTEHHSIDVLYGNSEDNLKVDSYGVIQDFNIQPNSAFEAALVTVHLANNEIGTIQPIKELVEKNPRFYFHVDATQAYGKIPIDVEDLGIDFLSASGHKIGAPKGIGFLYARKTAQNYLEPMIYGSQEFGKRGGTENVPYIIALAEAVNAIDYLKQERFKQFYEYAVKQSADWATPNGHPTNRLYNIISLTIKQPINGQALIALLHDQEEYVSAGSACTAYDNKPSHVLRAIGLSEEEATRTLRISFPDDVTKKDIDQLFKKIQQNIEILKLLSVPLGEVML